MLRLHLRVVRINAFVGCACSVASQSWQVKRVTYRRAIPRRSINNISEGRASMVLNLARHGWKILRDPKKSISSFTFNLLETVIGSHWMTPPPSCHFDGCDFFLAAHTGRVAEKRICAFNPTMSSKLTAPRRSLLFLFCYCLPER